MRIQQTHAYSAVNQQRQQLAFSTKVVDSGHTMSVLMLISTSLPTYVKSVSRHSFVCKSRPWVC